MTRRSMFSIGRTGYRLRIGKGSTLGATYTYLRPYGYTPYQFDYAGSTNLLGLNLAVREAQSFRLSVGTGYDFNNLRSQPGFRAAPYQTISTQALYIPSAAFAFRTTASYDLNNNRLVDLTNTLRVRGSHAPVVRCFGALLPYPAPVHNHQCQPEPCPSSRTPTHRKSPATACGPSAATTASPAASTTRASRSPARGTTMSCPPSIRTRPTACVPAPHLP